MEIANETLPKSIEAKEFSALFCRDRHASGIGCAIPHDPTSNQVHVFEAPIDLMSYLSLHRELINAVITDCRTASMATFMLVIRMSAMRST